MEQQLAVRATYEDGSTEDVTRITTYLSSDLAIAQVDQSGFVQFQQQGEVAILCRYMGQLVSVRLMHIAKAAHDFRWPNPPTNNFVDHHVFSKLQLLNIAPSDICSDETFVRRVYLDLCGILPSPDETSRFIATTDPNKREQLVDQVLDRSEFTDYWTKKWMLQPVRNCKKGC